MTTSARRTTIGPRSNGRSFAAATEPIELREGRTELVREAAYWLTVWTESRDAEARGRLLQSLDALRLLVGAP